MRESASDATERARSRGGVSEHGNDSYHHMDCIWHSIHYSIGYWDMATYQSKEHNPTMGGARQKGRWRVMPDQTVKDLIVAGLTTDGEAHKQWYLEQIAELLGVSLWDRLEYEPGVPP